MCCSSYRYLHVLPLKIYCAFIFPDITSSSSTCKTAKHQQVTKRVPSEAIRAMQARCSFPCRKQTGNARHLRIMVNTNTAHEVVQCWSHFHRLLCDINLGKLFELVIHGRKFSLYSFCRNA